MPGYDGTGPRGMGPMTGSGRGYCAMPAERPVGNMPAGRFLRRGGGRGWCNWYYAAGIPGWQRSAYGYPAYSRQYPYTSELTAEEEKKALRSEAELLKQELSDIQSRISALETDKEYKENQ